MRDQRCITLKRRNTQCCRSTFDQADPGRIGRRDQYIIAALGMKDERLALSA
jgi:hypothetical protein